MSGATSSSESPLFLAVQAWPAQGAEPGGSMSTYTSRLPHALQFQDLGQEVLLVRTFCERLTLTSDHEEKIIDTFPHREAAVGWLHREYGAHAVRQFVRLPHGWHGVVDEAYGCVRWAAGLRLEDTYRVFNG